MQAEVASTAVDDDCDSQQQDGDMYYGGGSEAHDVADDDHHHMGTRSSRLSVESSDSDAGSELCDGKKEVAGSDDNDDVITLEFNAGLSLPGTPEYWCSPRLHPETRPPVWVKEYASEREAPPTPGCRRKKKKKRGEYHHRRSSRESRLELTWEMRRCHCTCVVVRPRGREAAACMCMDMEEVRACRDLGLELPCDWTVEIPTPEAFHRAAAPPADTSSGGDSPVGSTWHISTPGDDPREVKARLRLWAQAVALASASRLGR